MRAHVPDEPVDVVLVGRRLPSNENLGLGYLLAALRSAGLHARLEVLNRWTELEPLASRILRDRPRLVGLSLPDGGSAFLPLGLGAYLRRRGYAGHVTAGGPFATLARDWLLARYDWLDSVVRFAGEVPLPELARRVAAGRPAHGTPGVTTRAGDGPPAPVLDPTPMQLVPERDVLPEVLGHPMVHIAATRGCPGRCAFCGPAALQAQERREALAAGADHRALRCAGVGTVRRRSLDALCDEMADLWHGRGVRYFYFVDEHLLPHLEADAVDYLARWQDGLRRRHVGPFGFGCMFRGDLLTPAVARALADVGLVRCFVGLELVSAEERRRFGRAGDAARAAAMMAELHRLGAATITNLMLVHPYSTSATIECGIEFAAGLPAGTFETTEMRPYHGTTLCERLRAEERLEGNPLRWSYRHLDPAAGRFAEILARLRGYAFRDYSSTYRLHDLALAVSLARRLHPTALDAATERSTADLTARLNDLRVRALRRALAAARSGVGFAGAADLVVAVRREAEALDEEIERLAETLQRRLHRPVASFRPMQAAAAHALRFCLATAPLAAAGCYDSHTEQDARVDFTTADDAVGEVPPDAEVAVDVDAGCTAARTVAANDQLRRALEEADACRSLCVHFYDWPTTEPFVSHAYADPRYCEASLPQLEETYGRVREALAGVDLDCADPRYLCLDQPDLEELATFQPQAHERCPEAFEGHAGSSGGWSMGEWYEVLFVIGPDGRVADIRPGPYAGVDTIRPEVLECLRSAFADLTFPCLAGYEVCPEFAIVE